MKKIILAVVIVLGLGGYVFWSTRNSGMAMSTSDATSTAAETTSPAAGSPVTGATPPATTPTSGFADGTYTGTAASSIYGNVQVAAVISGGKITAINVLQSPNSQPNSIVVSNHSLPILTQEAISIQGAKVDIVSGATQTSQAFQETLGSALSQASQS